MARKHFSDEDVLNLQRQIELSLTSGSDVATYYIWCKWYGGMRKPQLSALKGLEKRVRQISK